MYNYSPIKRMLIKNFRNLGEVDVDFTQSPIITLVGENEAGKTSLIKAFSMCALHDSPRDQKDYIRDGTNGLGIQIDLEDGTSIVRVKQTNGVNMYRVINPDGTIWNANKITDGLPELVAEKMGLIIEPETNEYLNVRTYEDKLLFVVTPASTNYKVMYNALKVEQLTKAIRQGSTEVNTLKAKVSRNDDSIQTLNEQLRQIVIYDTEPLRNVKDSIQNQIQNLDRLKKLSELVDKLEALREKLGAIELINVYKLEPINETDASRITGAIRLINNLSNAVSRSRVYNEVNNLSEIDINALDKVDMLRTKVGELKYKTEIASKFNEVASLNSIDESTAIKANSAISHLYKLESLRSKALACDTSRCIEISDNEVSAVTKMNTVIGHIAKIAEYKATLEQYNGYIEQIQNYMTQCGVAVETCPKCGENIVFDLDKMK